jgi:polyisoprenoid-binding protein YceI
MKVTSTLRFLLAPAFAISLFATSCAENPADNVPSAEILESESEAADPTEAAAPEETAAPSAEARTYHFTDESTIGFIGSKVTGSHVGGFKVFSGSFVVEGDAPGNGPHRIEIDMESTWSDDDRLTGHLKNEDFFDVPHHPTSVFSLDTVTPAEGDDAYTLTGDLTLRGATKRISFPATIKAGEGDRIHLDAEFSINRKDFGIVYAGRADDLIRDEVVIQLAMVAAPAE